MATSSAARPGEASVLVVEDQEPFRRVVCDLARAAPHFRGRGGGVLGRGGGACRPRRASQSGPGGPSHARPRRRRDKPPAGGPSARGGDRARPSGQRAVVARERTGVRRVAFMGGVCGYRGALVGARRPTVSLALLVLDQQQLLRRREDPTWLLPMDSVQWPTTGVPDGRARLA